jgi:hypothetical protein
MRDRKLSENPRSKIYLRMLIRLGEKFGTTTAAPIIKETLNEHLSKRPLIDANVSNLYSETDII